MSRHRGIVDIDQDEIHARGEMTDFGRVKLGGENAIDLKSAFKDNRIRDFGRSGSK
jgi:hypothetical protein